MRVGLNEDNELTIARFIKGLSPSIAHKVELQPYLSFNDIFHLAIKIEKQLKGRKPFATPSPHRPQSTPKSFLSYNKGDTIPTPTKTIDKGKGIASESPKGLGGKSASNAMVMDTSKWIVPIGEPSLLERWKRSKL